MSFEIINCRELRDYASPPSVCLIKKSLWLPMLFVKNEICGHSFVKAEIFRGNLIDISYCFLLRYICNIFDLQELAIWTGNSWFIVEDRCGMSAWDGQNFFTTSRSLGQQGRGLKRNQISGTSPCSYWGGGKLLFLFTYASVANFTYNCPMYNTWFLATMNSRLLILSIMVNS